MSQNILEQWKDCKYGTLGSVLYDTGLNWKRKLLKGNEKRELTRYRKWVADMQHRGMFGSCDCEAPKTSEFGRYLKQVMMSVEQYKMKLQNTGKWQKGKVTKQVEEAETFLTNCRCFLPEIKNVLQTQSSKQTPMPATTPDAPVTTTYAQG